MNNLQFYKLRILLNNLNTRTKNLAKVSWEYSVKHKGSITKIIAAISLIVTVYFGSKQIDLGGKMLKQSEKQTSLIEQNLEKNKRAIIDINYFAESTFDKPKIRISNSGELGADSIWLSQEYYLISDSGEVFECDLPAYSYIMFKGSKSNMFCLKAGIDTLFQFQPKCFGYFLRLLLEKCSGQLITIWRADFNHHNNPIRNYIEKTFILYDNQLNKPYSPDKITGGVGTQKNILNYKENSSIKKYEYKQNLGEYALNPSYIREMSDNSVILEGKFDNFNISASGSGYVSFEWECETEVIEYRGKTAMFSGSPPY